MVSQNLILVLTVGPHGLYSRCLYPFHTHTSLHPYLGICGLIPAVTETALPRHSAHLPKAKWDRAWGHPRDRSAHARAWDRSPVSGGLHRTLSSSKVDRAGALPLYKPSPSAHKAPSRCPFGARPPGWTRADGARVCVCAGIQPLEDDPHPRSPPPLRQGLLTVLHVVGGQGGWGVGLGLFTPPPHALHKQMSIVS